MLTRLALIALLLPAAPVLAADLPGRGGDGERYTGWRRHGLTTQVEIDCLAEWRRLNPRGAPIRATNSLCDPTYIGSGYGLARPSYYGTLPRLGHTAYGWTGPEGP